MKRPRSSSSSSGSAEQPAQRAEEGSSSYSESDEEPAQQSTANPTSDAAVNDKVAEKPADCSSDNSSSSSASAEQPAQESPAHLPRDASDSNRKRCRSESAHGYASYESYEYSYSYSAEQPDEQEDTTEQRAEQPAEQDATAQEQEDTHTQTAMRHLLFNPGEIKVEYIVMPSRSFVKCQHLRDKAVQALKDSVSKGIDIINMAFPSREAMQTMWDELEKVWACSAEQPAYSFRRTENLLTVFATKLGPPNDEEGLTTTGVIAICLSFATQTGKLTISHACLHRVPSGIRHAQLNSFLAPPSPEETGLRLVGGPLGPALSIQSYASESKEQYEYYSEPADQDSSLDDGLGDTSALIKISNQSGFCIYTSTKHSIAAGALILMRNHQTAAVSSVETSASTHAAEIHAAELPMATREPQGSDVNPADALCERSEPALNDTPDNLPHSETPPNNGGQHQSAVILDARGEQPRTPRVKLTPRKEAVRLVRRTPLWRNLKAMIDMATETEAGRYVLLFINATLFWGELRSREANGKFLPQQMSMAAKMECLLETALRKRQECIDLAQADTEEHIDSKTFEIPERYMRQMSK